MESLYEWGSIISYTNLLYIYVLKYSDTKTSFLLFPDVGGLQNVFPAWVVATCVCEVPVKCCWRGDCTKSFCVTTGSCCWHAVCSPILISISVLYGSGFCGKFLRNNKVTFTLINPWPYTKRIMCVVKINVWLKMLFADQRRSSNHIYSCNCPHSFAQFFLIWNQGCSNYMVFPLEYERG